MNTRKYNVNEIVLLDTQKMLRDKLNHLDEIYVGDEHFAQVKGVLDRNEIPYQCIRDDELKINTLLVLLE